MTLLQRMYEERNRKKATARPTPPRATIRPALTFRQAEILEWITEFARRGYSPTFREIGDQFGIRSLNGVAYVIRALQNKGYVSRVAAQARGLTVVRDDGACPSCGCKCQKGGVG